MRKPNVFSHSPKAIIPRMSWSKENLYNLLLRSSSPNHVGELNFNRTALTMYQQRWRSKRFLRGYHGDWIPERRFKRWLVPDRLPRFDQRSSLAALQTAPSRRSGVGRGASSGASPFTRSRILTQALAAAHREIGAEERMPTASLFMREVERRLDVVVFRCCFATSAYQARALIVQGHVKLNGFKVTDPNKLLEPGDLVSVEPSAVPLLNPKAAAREAKLAEQREAAHRRRRAADLKEIEERRGAPRNRESPKAEEATETEEGTDDAKEATETTQADGESTAQADGESASAAPEAADEASAEAKSEAETSVEAEAESSADANASEAEKPASAASAEGTKSAQAPKARVELPPGVLPFTLPEFAAPFLFIPPYLEVSFKTCSAIYMRHPTIVPVASASAAASNSDSSRDVRSSDPTGSSGSTVLYRTDIPSPYPAGGDMYSMAWEHYARDAPRTRSDIRRIKVEAKHGRNGFESARAKDAYKTVRAIRRGKTASSAASP